MDRRAWKQWAAPCSCLALFLAVSAAAPIAGNAGETGNPGNPGKTGRTGNASPGRPNIVLILTDDQDLEDTACYGGRVLTPHIDELAAQGMRFDRAYVSSALCTPSRYSLLTGRYASRSLALRERLGPTAPVRIVFNTPLTDGETTIAEMLRDGGYATGMVGKWMLGAERGAQVPSDADPDAPEIAKALASKYAAAIEEVKRRGFDYVSSLYFANIGALGIPSQLQHHNHEWITQGALDFIERNHARPFFLFMATTLIHTPNTFDSLQADPRITPRGMLDEAPDVQPTRNSVIQRGLKANIPNKRIAMTWLDDGVGALLQRLEALGLADDTAIFLLSDHQTRGKMTCYEGARVPFLVRWRKRIDPGSRNDRLVSNIDVVPTLLDMAGVDPPEGLHLDGRSLLPIFEGRKVEAWRDSLYLEIGYTRAVVTSDRWKYIALRYPESLQTRIDSGLRQNISQVGGRKTNLYHAPELYPAYYDYDQLYDLNTDPEEQRNLATIPEQAARLGEMKSLLTGYSAGLPHAFGEFSPGAAANTGPATSGTEPEESGSLHRTR